MMRKKGLVHFERSLLISPVAAAPASDEMQEGRLPPVLHSHAHAAAASAFALSSWTSAIMALVVSDRGCVLQSGAGDLCGVDDTGCDEVFELLGRCVKAEPIGIRITLLRIIIGRFDRNIAGLTRFLLFLSKTQDRLPH